MYLYKNLIWPGLFILLLVSGCVTSIKKIKNNSARFNGKKVCIKGRVISSLDLHEINCFTLRDRSAYILVVTDNMLPLKNDKIRVKGIVEEKYPYKTKDLLVVKEKKMKLRKAPPLKKIKDKL
jgi:hypothetical protein